MATIGARDAYLTEVILALRDQLSAEGARAGATLDKLDRSTDSLTSSFDQTSRASDRFGTSLKSLGLKALALNEIRGLILSLLAPLQQVGELSDTWKELTARVAIFGEEGANTAQTMGRIAQIAQESRTPLKDVGTLYARLAQGLSEQNVSQEELLGMVQAMSDALLLSGASASEAGGAIMQFSQAMASGVLRGEEFNAVAEQSPVILDAMAKELGVSKGQLRDLAMQGQITSQVLRRSIAGMSEEWRKQAETIPLTIGRAMENLKSAFTEYLGTADKVPEMTEAFAKSLQFLANNLHNVGDAIDTVGMVAMITLLLRGASVVGIWSASLMAADQAKRASIASNTAVVSSEGLVVKSKKELALAQERSLKLALQEAEAGRALAMNDLGRAEDAKLAAAAEIQKAEATIQSTRAAQEAAGVSARMGVARLSEAKNTKLVVESTIALSEAALAAAPALAQDAEFTEALARARIKLRLANTEVTLAERALARQFEATAGTTAALVMEESRLAMLRNAHKGDVAAVAAAELANSAAITKTVKAQSALKSGLASFGGALKELGSLSGALNASMSIWMGYEVGAMLREWAMGTEIGAAGFRKLDEGLQAVSANYRDYREQEDKAKASKEGLAKMLKEVNFQTGLNIETMKQYRDGVESGLIVEDKRNGTWQRGIAVAKELVQGMGDVDSAYARTVKALEKDIEANRKRAKSETELLETKASTLKALGSERQALDLLSAAKINEVAAAQAEEQATRNVLAVSEARLLVARQQAQQRGADSAAVKDHIATLERDAVAARAAADAGLAHVEALQAEQVATKAATLTYGDQSAKLIELKNAQDAIVAELGALAEAEARTRELTAAKANLLDISERYYEAARTGGDDLQALTADYLAAKIQIEELSVTQAADEIATARSAQLHRDLALSVKLVADAAEDAATRIDEKVAALGREQALLAARADIQMADIARRRDMATAAGEEIVALNLTAELYRQELNLLRESADAKREEAELLRQKTNAMEIAAKADGDFTMEERAAVDAMRDMAEMAGLSAKRMGIDVKAKRDALDATRALANQQRVLGEEFAKAGAKGVKTMDDVRQAIAAAASSQEIEALGRALREAFERGVLGAEEYKAALDEILSKTKELKDANASRKMFVDFEQLFKQYGTDISRVQAASPGDRQGLIAEEYRKWLEQQGAYGEPAQAAPSTAKELFDARRAKLDEQQAAKETQAGNALTDTQGKRGYFRTVRVELVSAGKTTPVDVVEGQETNLIAALRRARIYSS
jgi:tape measure domain-containing protein